MRNKKWYKKLNKQTKDKLLDDITALVMDLYIHIKCLKCKRKLPNEDFFSKNGCLWCDIDYFYKQRNKKRYKHKKYKGLCKNK